MAADMSARAERVQQLGQAVPAAMRERPQWLLYRLEQTPGEKKPRKVPYYVSGHRRMGKQGSDEDRQALVSFEQMLDRLGKGGYDGAGFAFLPGDGLIGIDVDRAIDPDTGEMAPHCREVIERCQSYTELSPSGTGVHVIVSGEIAKTFKDNEVGVEVFQGRQFFTVTGRPFGGTPAVEPISAETVAWLHALVKGPAAAPAPMQSSAQPRAVQHAMPDASARNQAASRYCLKALASAEERVRFAGPGKRNDTLNSEAYGLAQLVHTGGISETTLRAVLTDAARACGLDDAEIGPTLNSGVSAGLAAPRDLPVRDVPLRSAQPASQRAVDPSPPPSADEAGGSTDEPDWLAAVLRSSPPTSDEAAPPRPKRGEGDSKVVALRKRSTKAQGGDDKPEWFWPRVDMLTGRYSLIYSTDTAWDNVQRMIVRVPSLRLAWGSDPVRAWLGRVASTEARMVMPTDLVFEPGNAVPAHQINMFGGLDLQPVECTADDVKPMLDLLRHLCKESSPEPDEVDELIHWILRWQAMPLQQVGTKMQTACVFHGAQGTGKNLYWDAWRDLFGMYGITVSQTEIEDKFNGWVSRKLAIIGDEVVSRQEMYHNKNRLKLIVTQEEKFAIRGMMMETRWESNHANVVFLSNESQPLALEERDRRYTVVYTPLEADAAVYEAVRVFKANGGLAKWMHYLQHYPLDGFTPHAKPPMTRAKAELIELNWRAPERFCHEWLEGYLDLPVRVCSAEQLFRAFRRWVDQTNSLRFTDQAGFTRQVERWAKERVQRGPDGRWEAPKLTYKQIALKDELAHRRTVRCWIPDTCAPPQLPGVSMGEWAHDSVKAFESDLAKFCRRPGIDNDSEG